MSLLKLSLYYIGVKQDTDLRANKMLLNMKELPLTICS